MNLLVWVAALGYFVDMYDITLFGVVRGASLAAMGLTDPAETLKAGIFLYNMQALGMVLGGLLWGVLADKKGRLKVLFGSILLYSVGNIANAFVTSVDMYAVCRFITGLGLAGELGAAITLVSESLPKEKRGIGTTIVATMGLFGAVCAAFIGQQLHWQTNYIIGGVMGLLLLFTRFSVSESAIFKSALEKPSNQGNLLLLFEKKRWLRYLRCVLLGTPVYFMTGIMFTFSPELTAGLNIQGDPVKAGQALLFGTIGLTIGDLLSGLLSQYLKSRRKAVFVSLSLATVGILAYLLIPGLTAQAIYVLCFILGMAGGYWAVLVTMSAEQFGTNIRGTVATSVPNFVRGSAILLTLSFNSMKNVLGIQSSALLLGAITMGLAFLSLYLMDETFSKDLDYSET
jgi:MFS transporter, putative metabolite:H+ symporter